MTKIAFEHKFSVNVDSLTTVWKYEHFSVTQILREITFGECKVQEMPFLQFQGLLNFLLGKFQPSENRKMHTNQSSKPLDVLQYQILHL